MTDVKAQELSYDEWRELLEPYGWADITTRVPAVLFRVPPGMAEYDIRVMLNPGPDSGPAEWGRRSDLLDQARRAVEAVQTKGYWLPDAPRIEFGGQYMYQVGETDPSWVAEAELRFTVRRASPRSCS